MIIKDFETFVVGNPPPRFGGRYFIFVKLVTDSGVVGYGEAYCATFGAKTVEAMLRDTAERFAVGRDPFHIEALWRSIYGAGYNLRPDVSLMAVLSALEMACWDIIGKECGKPVYELLGVRSTKSSEPTPISIRSRATFIPVRMMPSTFTSIRSAPQSVHYVT